MKHVAFVYFCLLSVFFLSACGQVEIPDTSSDGDTIVIPPEDSTNDTADKNGENLAVVPEDEKDTPLQLCEAEKEKLSTALEVNTTALEKCEEDRQRFGDRLQNLPSDDDGAERYQRFITFYLENSEMREYPFPKCGPVSTLASETWFADFKSKLEAAQIPFGNKIVETGDLSGGCVSPEGGMAFFLGAENEALSEFHLLKYILDTKQIEEAFLGDGTCTICPNQLGKRQGKFLTVFGEKEGTKVEYDYYYDANILKRK